MKTNYTFIFLLFFAAQLFSQNIKKETPTNGPVPEKVVTPLFEKIESGALVGSLSDSRSVNFVDVDNDGWEDVFISNGTSSGAFNFLFKNNGAGNFSSVAATDVIVSHAEPFDGATFADADNDGDLDAFVVTWYGKKNYLYWGNGDGTFSYDDNAAPSVLGTYSETAAWGDMDNDGDLDLYVTNSTNLNGIPLKNNLFRNEGNGSFTKIDSGPAAEHAHASRSVNWVDFDDDCDLDLFVSNEGNQPDDLYLNDGAGNFTIAPNAPSQSNRSTMSSSWGDIDQDGDLDLFVANAAYFGEQNNQLFRNNGNGSFTEITTGDLVTDGGCSYGSNFGDYDNDGDLDLVVSNGYCNGTITNFLYKNDGTGQFSRDLESIDNLETPCSYGAAWGDINNDGFLDLGIATCKNNTGASLSKNLFYQNLGNANNWLKIKPIGTQVNRSAIGAKVFVKAIIGGVEKIQMREISAQSGYCGQNSLYAHFGLGDAVQVLEVRVQFSCSSEVTLTNIAANQLIEITEADANPATEILPENKLTIKINPNPASGQFIISVQVKDYLKNVELNLIDTTGRIVWKDGFVNKQSSIYEKTIYPKNIGLNSGVYILKIIGEDFVKSEMVTIN